MGRGETRDEQVSRRIVEIMRHFAAGLRDENNAATLGGGEILGEFRKTFRVGKLRWGTSTNN